MHNVLPLSGTLPVIWILECVHCFNLELEVDITYLVHIACVRCKHVFEHCIMPCGIPDGKILVTAASPASTILAAKCPCLSSTVRRLVSTRWVAAMILCTDRSPCVRQPTTPLLLFLQSCHSLIFSHSGACMQIRLRLTTEPQGKYAGCAWDCVT